MTGREVIYFFIGILSLLLVAVSFIKPFIRFVFRCAVTVFAIIFLKNIGLSIGLNAFNVFLGGFLGIPAVGAVLLISSFL